MSNLEKLTRLVELLREHRIGQQPQNDAPSRRSNSYPSEREQATYKATDTGIVVHRPGVPTVLISRN
jgi:hypothetical protein